MSITSRLIVSTALAFATTISYAAPIVLTFEGIANNTAVGNFYNGGAGINYGISFSPDTLALIDQDKFAPGGGDAGNFANEPSPDTIMFFLNSNNAILNYSAGFEDGFSFFYSSATRGSVTVWDGLNGTGKLLGTLSLSVQNTLNCVGDPTGEFCNWTPLGITFDGRARSINFGGAADQTGFDDITFGSEIAGGKPKPVPLPATAALVVVGLLALRRKN
jgi:hypothetical protein